MLRNTLVDRLMDQILPVGSKIQDACGGCAITRDKNQQLGISMTSDFCSCYFLLSTISPSGGLLFFNGLLSLEPMAIPFRLDTFLKTLVCREAAPKVRRVLLIKRRALTELSVTRVPTS